MRSNEIKPGSFAESVLKMLDWPVWRLLNQGLTGDQVREAKQSIKENPDGAGYHMPVWYLLFKKRE